MNPDAIVDMLAPLRSPASISWWPPAPGWWVLGTLLLALLILAVRWLWRLYRRGAPLRAARAEFARIEAATLSQPALVEALTQLQRRIAIALAGRRACAGLTGKRWIEFLNSLAQGDEQHFSPQMSDLAYRGPVDADECAALMASTRRWLDDLARPQ
jgi:hypothetical protein